MPPDARCDIFVSIKKEIYFKRHPNYIYNIFEIFLRNTCDAFHKSITHFQTEPSDQSKYSKKFLANLGKAAYGAISFKVTDEELVVRSVFTSCFRKDTGLLRSLTVNLTIFLPPSLNFCFLKSTKLFTQKRISQPAWTVQNVLRSDPVYFLSSFCRKYTIPNVWTYIP